MKQRPTFRRNCEGTTRRDCLQYGLGALLGTGLVDSLRVRGESAKHGSGPVATAKRCILIWMDGGPTHFETFDPKPDAPAEFRGEFSEVKTSVPGVLFSEHMTRLAASLDDYSIIRSIRHNQGIATEWQAIYSLAHLAHLLSITIPIQVIRFCQ